MQFLWGARTVPVALTWSLGGPLVFVEEAAEDWSALDSFQGEIGYRVAGSILPQRVARNPLNDSA
jgi:hypothetical protein